MMPTQISEQEDDSSLSSIANVTDTLQEQQAIAPIEVSLRQKQHNPEGTSDHQLCQSVGNASTLVGLVERSLSSDHAGDETDVLQTLQERNSLSKTEAEHVLSFLLETTSSQPSVPLLLGSLLSHQEHARRSLPAEIKRDAQTVLQRCLATGADGATSLTISLLTEQFWDNKAERLQAISTISKLCMADLRGVEKGQHTELVLGMLVRLLSTTDSKTLLNNPDEAIDSLVSLLDIRRPQTVQSRALLILMRVAETTDDGQGTPVMRTLLQKGSSKSHDDLMIAFSAAAALFPIMTKSCTELLTNQQVLREVLSCLKPSAGIISDDLDKSIQLRDAALSLLSASCVDKSCRAIIKKDCGVQLKSLEDDHDARCATLTTLIIVKSGISDGEVETSIKIAVQNSANSTIAFETLAYSSLNPRHKETMASDQALVAKIISTLSTQNDAVLSCMTILANLCAFRASQSKEQEKLAQLKAYAEANRPQQDDRRSDDAAVIGRCQRLIDAQIVPAIISCCKTTQTITILSLSARVIHSLARVTKQRGKLVQQGVIGILLRIREVAKRAQPSTTVLQAVSTTSAHALGRILISVDPAHAFIGTVSAEGAVDALASLLRPAIEEGRRDWLPTFESLLALTNLASMDDSARDIIVASSWTIIEDDLLLADNIMVRRACVELICNLTQSPSGVAKFADGSEAANRRLHILLVLSDVEDLSTRRGAAGALAMLTGWEGVGEKLVAQPKGLSLLLKIATDNADDIRHRGLVCIMNIITAPGKAGQHSLAAVKRSNGSEMLQNSLKTTRDEELLAITNELLTLLS